MTDSTYDFVEPVAGVQPDAIRRQLDDARLKLDGAAGKPASDAAVRTEGLPKVPRQSLPEMPCPACGFMIVGKPRHNRCPECRAPLDGDQAERLQFAPAGWLRKMSWGALVMALAVPAHAYGAYLAAGQRDSVGGGGLQVAGAGLTLAGLWMVTAHGEIGPPPHSQRRWGWALAARWLALGALVMWAGALVSATGRGATAWLTVPALGLMAGEAVAFGLFAGGLCARIPHDGLVNQMRNFALLLPGLFGFLVIYQFYDMSPYYGIFFCSLPLIGALAGMAGWVAATLARLFLELRHTATAAEEIARKHFQTAEAAARGRGDKVTR